MTKKQFVDKMIMFPNPCALPGGCDGCKFKSKQNCDNRNLAEALYNYIIKDYEKEIVRLTSERDVLQSERDNLMQTLEEGTEVVEEAKIETALRIADWLEQVQIEADDIHTALHNLAIQIRKNCNYEKPAVFFFVTADEEKKARAILKEFHEWANNTTTGEVKAAEDPENLTYFLLRNGYIKKK